MLLTTIMELPLMLLNLSMVFTLEDKPESMQIALNLEWIQIFLLCLYYQSIMDFKDNCINKLFCSLVQTIILTYLSLLNRNIYLQILLIRQLLYPLHKRQLLQLKLMILLQSQYMSKVSSIFS